MSHSLLILVPVLVLPVVLLFAFAGCGSETFVATPATPSPRFTQGPLCTISDTEMVCTGSMADLGKDPVVIKFDVAAQAMFDCVNAAGQPDPSGPKPVAFPNPKTMQTPPLNPSVKGELTLSGISLPSVNSATAPACSGRYPTPRLDRGQTTVILIMLTISQGGSSLTFKNSTPASLGQLVSLQ